MPQGEVQIIAGSASQIYTRWGDYSSMNVDPVDDRTFWYTNEYVRSDGRWNTRIASFKFRPWAFCIKDVAYMTEYWMDIEFGRLLRGQALTPDPNFPAPITRQFDPGAIEATFSVDYLNEAGSRFYRVDGGTMTGETWGIRDADSSYYDGPRSATLEPCTSVSSESAEGKTGAMTDSQ